MRQGKYGGGGEHGYRRIREKTFFGSSSTFSRKGKQKTRDYIPSRKSRTKTGNRTETKSLFLALRTFFPSRMVTKQSVFEQNFRGPRVRSSHNWSYKQTNKQTNPRKQQATQRSSAFAYFFIVVINRKKRLTKLISSIRVIRKVILSSPCLWASFHPLSPLSVVCPK